MTGNNPLYYVVHGHFYQPPRENPWLGIIERQPSAKPYHDWNERIYDECYRPNSHSRILDAHGMIRSMHNNYRMMSFNFGPTLFRWLEKEHPRTAELIVEADQDSCLRLNNHGNAITQVYNHIIMPLASRRDQLTQIRWAKAYFRSRFGREPEGIWLAETAINMDTVLCLIEEGIKFTVLSPNQAEAFRALDRSEWIRTEQQPVDPRRPYRVFAKDKNGKELGGYIDVFFFDEPLSRAISFGDVLASSERLAGELQSRFSNPRSEGEAVVIATDGETFGHHKPLTDMCLAFLFTKAGPDRGLHPVNFGYLLEKHPPRCEVTLKDAFGEGTAWSCAHGVGRWIRNCGCNTGGAQGWNQNWRTPFRRALETAQKRLDDRFETTLRDIVDDPWRVRDEYITFMDTPSMNAMKESLEHQGTKRALSLSDVEQIRRLLEAQKFALFSFTSCAWFFSDISGIETLQNMAYACRALQLGLSKADCETVVREVMDILSTALSNVGGKTGKMLFEATILPMSDHLKRLVFTAAAERTVLGEKSLRPHYFGYAISLERSTRRIGSPKESIIYRAEITNELSAERSSFWVLISHRRGANVSGKVLSETHSHEFDVRDPGAWESRDTITQYTLASLHEESKEAFVSAYRGRIMQHTPLDYESWMEENGKALQSLADLRRPLDSAVSGFVQHVLSARWNRLVARLTSGHDLNRLLDEMEEVFTIANRLSLGIGLSETARSLENLLATKAQRLHEAIDLNACDEISLILNVVDRFSVPLGKNKLEDAFFSVLTTSVRGMYEEYRQGINRSSERESVLRHLLGFAHRMNFNTDDFPMP